MLKDSIDRSIDYMRISVTEQCNLKCLYCVPKEYLPACASGDLLTDSEILKAASLFSSLGVSSIRITGGEPLMRPGLCDLIFKIKSIPEISDVSMTTNGIYLKKLAPALKHAGLNRVNISIDTLSPLRFKLITGSDSLKIVLAGLEAAIEAGLSPVKINVVLFRGINDTEIEEFVSMTENRPIHLRFIEAMPMGGTALSFRNRRISPEIVLKEVPSLKPVPTSQYPQGKGPARYFSLPDARGTVGFIHAVSDHFCSSCNRIRLSSRGTVFPCLDSRKGVYIRDILNLDESGANPEPILRDIVWNKPPMHKMAQRISEAESGALHMCNIGG